jgi:hypothetical protein
MNVKTFIVMYYLINKNQKYNPIILKIQTFHHIENND